MEINISFINIFRKPFRSFAQLLFNPAEVLTYSNINLKKQLVFLSLLYIARTMSSLIITLFYSNTPEDFTTELLLQTATDSLGFIALFYVFSILIALGLQLILRLIKVKVKRNKLVAQVAVINTVAFLLNRLFILILGLVSFLPAPTWLASFTNLASDLITTSFSVWFALAVCDYLTLQTNFSNKKVNFLIIILTLIHLAFFAP